MESESDWHQTPKIAAWIDLPQGLFAYQAEAHLSLPHDFCHVAFWLASPSSASKCKLMFLKTIIWRTPSEIYVHLNFCRNFLFFIFQCSLLAIAVSYCKTDGGSIITAAAATAAALLCGLAIICHNFLGCSYLLFYYFYFVLQSLLI